MPEGPEVRREADRIEAVLLDTPLESVQFGLKRLEGFVKTLVDSHVTSVETRGKAMLVHFNNDLILYSHNQLYGRWAVCRRGKLPATNRSLRVGLHTANHSAILYSASDVEVLQPHELEKHPFLRKLGPDVLSPNLGWREIAARLKAPSFIRRSLASIYLDQRFLAGIGNYMRSEILHEAGLNPFIRPSSLKQGERGRLARATRLISDRAYQQAGVTNPPGRVRTLKRLGLSFSDYRFAVFARDGLPCYRCDGKIVRGEVSSRRLYYCPHCQAER